MSQTNQIVVARTEAGYVVSVTGQGTRQESPAVRDFISGAMEDKAHVVLDLSQCEYLDSTFLGCLVVLHKRSCQHGERFRVYADDAVIRKLLHPTRLDTVIPCCEASPNPQGEAVPLPDIKLDREEFGRHLLDTHEELANLDSPSSSDFRKVAEHLRRELGDL